jgi:hypothetical protein
MIARAISYRVCVAVIVGIHDDIPEPCGMLQIVGVYIAYAPWSRRESVARFGLLSHDLPP